MVSELLGGRNIEEFHFSLLRDIPDEMIPELDVFVLRVLNWVLGYKDGTGVVTADSSLKEFVPIVEQLILDP